MTLKYRLGLFALALFAIPATAASAYYGDTTPPPATQVTTPEYIVSAYAVDDAGNWEEEGSSILVTVQ